jgi:AraC family L-rhamnose operon regulatory protein RhaS
MNGPSAIQSMPDRGDPPPVPQHDRPIEVRMPSHGVYVFESHHTTTFRADSRAHDFLEVFLVTGGSGAFLIEGRPHRCHSGDVVIIPIGRSHWCEDEPDQPLSLYGLCVAAHAWRDDPSLPRFLPTGVVSLGTTFVPQIRGFLRRLRFEQGLDRIGNHAALQGITLQLLVQLARIGCDLRHGARRAPREANGDRRGVIRSYVDELRRDCLEPGDLDHAASELGMSRRRFTQLFREVAGTSWSEFVLARRIDHACRLLAQTRRSIEAIALECGYKNLPSFYRAFKSRTHATPHQWRLLPATDRASGDCPEC